MIIESLERALHDDMDDDEIYSKQYKYYKETLADDLMHERLQINDVIDDVHDNLSNDDYKAMIMMVLHGEKSFANLGKLFKLHVDAAVERLAKKKAEDDVENWSFI